MAIFTIRSGSIAARVRDIFRRKPTTTTTDVAPTTKPSVTVIDVGTATQERTGAITVTGAGGLSTGGRSGGRGTVTQLTPGVSVEQAEQVVQGLPIEQQASSRDPRTITSLRAVGQQQPAPFVGAVTEQTPTGERQAFFRGGQRVGQIVTTPTGERFAQVDQPGTITIQPSGEVTQQFTFAESGATILETTTAQVPELVTSSPELSMQEERMAIIEERQKLPPLERISLAYKSVPGDLGISFRGGVRASLEAVQIVTEKLKIPGGPAISTRFVEDVALFTAFSPLTATTFQIERELYGVPITKFAGTTQQVSKEGIETQTVFKVTRAGRTERGVFASVTRVTPGSKASSFVSTGRGATFNFFKVPYRTTASNPNVFAESNARLIFTKIKESFASGEFGLLQKSGRVLVQKGAGGTGTFKITKVPFKITNINPNVFAKENLRSIFTQAAPGEFFRSSAVGTKAGDGVVSAGITSTREGISLFTGFLKNVRITPTVSFTAVPSGTGGGSSLLLRPTTALVQSQVGRIAFATTQAQVAAKAITLIPAQTPLGLQSVVAGVTTSLFSRTKVSTQEVTPKQLQVPKTTTTFIPTQKVTQVQDQPQGLRLGGGQSYSQVSTQQQKEILSTTTAQIPAQIPAQSQKIFQAQRSIQRQQQQTSRLGFTTTIPTRIPKEPKPKLFIPLRTLPRATPSFGGAKLFVKEKGIFKFRGAFASPYKAVSAGKFITGQTIQRSFKVTGAKVGTPFGFRRSRKKGQEDVFVELSKTALSQRGEQQAVQLGRILKGGRK